MRCLRLSLLLWVCLIWTATAHSQEHNNLWVMWERVVNGQPKSQFRSHLLLDVPPAEAQTFFNNLAPSAQTYGAANVSHETSPLCLSQPPPKELTSIDTTPLTLADKVATLGGLNGVFVDFRAVRGPRTFTGNFGETVHSYVISQLQQAGIPLLTKEEVETTPGKPTLTLRYSVEVVGCKPWSVSLGLTQLVVLTRDTSIMLNTTTWSGSARQSESDIEYGAMEALRDVVAAFTEDYAKANSIIGGNAVTQIEPAN